VSKIASAEQHRRETSSSCTASGVSYRPSGVADVVQGRTSVRRLMKRHRASKPRPRHRGSVNLAARNPPPNTDFGLTSRRCKGKSVRVGEGCWSQGPSARAAEAILRSEIHRRGSQ
jgi:hypothetical protein